MKNPVQHRNADEYVQFKKENLQREMEMKKQKVLEKVKNGYYQGANSALLERQLHGYKHDELVDRLAHGAFKK
jgi:F0F1-type ATP synthase membrane subunit b/b'